MPSPSKFLPEARDKIIAALREGGSFRSAAGVAGVGNTTLFEWLARGEAEADDPESEFARFARDVEQARAESEQEAVTQIRKAGKESWQALAWWLERARPDDWAKDDWRKGSKPKDDERDFDVDLSPTPPPSAPQPGPADDVDQDEAVDGR